MKKLSASFGDFPKTRTFLSRRISESSNATKAIKILKHCEPHAPRAYDHVSPFVVETTKQEQPTHKNF